MATNKTPGTEKPAPRFGAYAIANIAGEYAKQGNELLTEIAVDEFRKQNLDIKGLDGKYIADWAATPESTNTLINIFSNAYNSSMADASFSDLFKWYAPSMKEANSGQKTAITSEFNKHGSEKFSNVIDSYQEAAHTLQRAKSSEEDKKKAQKVIEKYNPVITANEFLQGKTRDAIKSKIEFAGLEKMITANNKPAKAA